MASCLFLISAIGGLLFVGSCTRPPPNAAWRDTSPHEIGYVTSSRLRLQYLDWGGAGTPIVFIHGSGDSPHYFDEMGPALSGQHRVVALARRGHGQSDRPTMPFSIDDLAGDVVQLMNHLKIGSAILVGFSFGGNEVTRIAERYPDRVDRIIYLDAAFDETMPWDSVLSTANPTPAEMASLDAFRHFVQRVWYPQMRWTATLESIFRDFTEVSADGTVRVPSDDVASSMQAIRNSYHRNYSAINKPALAVFAERYELLDATADATARARNSHWHTTVYEPWQRSTIERLERELVGVRVVRLSGIGHNALPVVAGDTLVGLIREFVASPP